MKEQRLFLSDLHLLARRSMGNELSETIRNAVRRADVAVLGGDVFDFKWSTYPNLDLSIRHSLDWLGDLMSANHHCQIHYVLGNHDAHPRFIQALNQLAESSCQQLQWHRHLLRIEDSVFLHGDVIDGPLNHEAMDLRRERKSDKLVFHKLPHLLYDVAVWAKLHQAVIEVEKRRVNVFAALTQYLTAYQQDLDHGVRQVYFGHIHRSFRDLQYGQLTFHNPGATIRGLPFQIIDASNK